MNINQLAKEVHDNAVAHGWWDKPPALPEANPVGVYRREFTMDPSGPTRISSSTWRAPIGRLRLCERPRSRLQRGFEGLGELPHNRLCEAGRKQPRAQDIPLEYGIVSRVSGLLAHKRHRARRISQRAGQDDHPRLRRGVDPQRRLPRRSVLVEDNDLGRRRMRSGLRP